MQSYSILRHPKACRLMDLMEKSRGMYRVFVKKNAPPVVTQSSAFVIVEYTPLRTNDVQVAVCPFEPNNNFQLRAIETDINNPYGETALPTLGKAVSQAYIMAKGKREDYYADMVFQLATKDPRVIQSAVYVPLEIYTRFKAWDAANIC